MECRNKNSHVVEKSIYQWPTPLISIKSPRLDASPNNIGSGVAFPRRFGLCLCPPTSLIDDISGETPEEQRDEGYEGRLADETEVE